MATVCEVCYVSSEGEFLNIFHEDHAEKNIADILVKHLQCVSLEGIESPQICVQCWTTLESFHAFCNLIEDLHRPQPDSCSSSEDESGDPEKGRHDYVKQYLHITDASSDELDEPHDDQNIEPIHEVVDADEAAIEVIDEDNMTQLDVTEYENNSIDLVNFREHDEFGDDNETSVKKHMENVLVKKYQDYKLIEFYGPMVCQICDLNRMAQSLPSIPYDTFAELKRHMLDVHHISRTYLQCPVCSKRMFIRCNLWQHIDMHNHPEKYNCPICDEIHQDLTAHFNNKHMEKEFECKHCSRKYPSANRLAAHVKTAHATKDVVCKKCNKAFSKYLIKVHMRSMHSEPVFVCEWCGKTYRTLAVLNNHKMQHRSVPPVVCPVCKQHVRPNYIDRHMKLMHTETQPIECSACRKSFLNKRTLQVHLNRSCSANVYHCATCNKNFKTAAKLTEHQKSHEASANIYYMCPICMKNFGSKSLLYVHQQELHKIKK